MERNKLQVQQHLEAQAQMSRERGPVLDVLAEKYPQAFFGGMVAMTNSHSLGDRDGCRRFRSRDGCALSALAIGIATARAASGRQCK
jgi:hypothetical protein